MELVADCDRSVHQIVSASAIDDVVSSVSDVSVSVSVIVRGNMSVIESVIANRIDCNYDGALHHGDEVGNVSASVNVRANSDESVDQYCDFGYDYDCG